jgi:hypothetical protein
MPFLHLSVGRPITAADALGLLADGRGFTSIKELRAATDAAIRETRATLAAHPPRPRRPITDRRSASATPSASRRRTNPAPARRRRPAARTSRPSWYIDAPSRPDWKL